MTFAHEPVLLQEAVEGLAVRPRGTYVDGTLGGGGHALAVCQQLSWDGHFIGLDRDPQALAAAEAVLLETRCRKSFLQGDFAALPALLPGLGVEKVDGILLDLGVSSHQLDEGQRGFSYMQDGPLDMRMDPAGRLTAEMVVNDYPKAQLESILRRYGEERFASRIASGLEKERAQNPIRTTGALSDLVKAVIPAKARRTGPHPAKRTFQAIRIEVNDELGQLEEAMEELPDLLASGGRLVVITFHSLEDRLVKEALQRRLHPCTCPPDLPLCSCGKVADIKKIGNKVIRPSPQELARNPRARSAKLRIAEKL